MDHVSNCFKRKWSDLAKTLSKCPKSANLCPLTHAHICLPPPSPRSFFISSLPNQLCAVHPDWGMCCSHAPEGDSDSFWNWIVISAGEKALSLEPGEA